MDIYRSSARARALHFLILSLFVAASCSTIAAHAQTSSESVVIEQLSDSQAKPHNLNNFDLLVFVFLAPDNPTAYTCMPTAEAMAMKTRQLGGAFFGVVSGASYSAPLVEAFRKECRANFPFLLDRHKSLDTICGAQDVGTAILVQGNKCRFSGPIDHRLDAPSVDSETLALEEALDVLARQKAANRRLIKTARARTTKEGPVALPATTPNVVDQK